MKKLILLTIIGLSLICTGYLSDPPPAEASLCFYMGSTMSGANQICYYDCLGGMVAITVPSIELCPMTIDM